MQAGGTIDPPRPSRSLPRQWPPRALRFIFVAVTWALPLAVALALMGLNPLGAWKLGTASSGGAPGPWSLCLGLGGLWLVLAHLGSFYAPSGVFGPTLLHGPGTRPLVALTFDDGPDPETTPKILQLLSRYGARATFFVIGERAAHHPEVLAAIARAGHQIESHSYHHSWWTAFTPRFRLAAELRAAQSVIAAASGRPPRWLRPPIGILSPEVVAAAQQVGLRLCAWSCKARDGLARTSVAVALSRLRAGLRPGAILLLHDAPAPPARPRSTRPAPAGQGPRSGHHDAAPGRSPTGPVPIAPAVLEVLLPELAARNLRAVTLDELLEPEGPPAA